MPPLFDAVFVPGSLGLLASDLVDSFSSLRGAVGLAGELLRARKATTLIVSSSGNLQGEGFGLVSGDSWQVDLGGGTVPHDERHYRGYGEEQIRHLVRRLRLSGIAAEARFYEPLDDGTAVALGLLDPGLDVTILPVSVPAASLRAGYRFGSVLGDLVREWELDAVWVSVGSLSHRAGKEPEWVSESAAEFDRDLLDTLAVGDMDTLIDLTPRRLASVAADARLGHIAPLLGFVGEGFRAEVLAYGGIYGTGNAVVSFRSGGRQTVEMELVGSGQVGGER